MSDNEFMSEAIEQSEIAKSGGGLPFGAVVVCDGKIVGRGYCEDKTTGDVTDHAELLAIRRACRALGRNDLQDCTIYCTNEPCLMCASGIFQAKIANIIIGLTRDDLLKLLRPRKIRLATLADDAGYHVNITTGVMKDEIMKLF